MPIVIRSLDGPIRRGVGIEQLELYIHYISIEYELFVDFFKLLYYCRIN